MEIKEKINELREAVTEDYWDSRENVDTIKKEIEALQEQLEQVQRCTRLYSRDFDYMWDNKGEEDPDVLWGIAKRHGIDESYFEGE